jgi:hypothetical protein
LGPIIRRHSQISYQSIDLSNPLSIVKLCSTLARVHYVKTPTSKRCGCGLLNGYCTSVIFRIPKNNSRMPFWEHPKGVNPLPPRVVLEKPPFSGWCFFKSISVEIRGTINSIQPYECKHSLMKQVSVKSW